jgi:hypothetical protein
MTELKPLTICQDDRTGAFSSPTAMVLPILRPSALATSSAVSPALAAIVKAVEMPSEDALVVVLVVFLTPDVSSVFPSA